MVQLTAWCHPAPSFLTSNDIGGVVADYGEDKHWFEMDIV